MKKTEGKNQKVCYKKIKRNNVEQGITLIALVITIIALLILAGVTIATLTGNNGILTRANKAKTNTEMAEIGEKKKMEFQELLLYIHEIGFSYVEGDIDTGVVAKDNYNNEFIWVPINRENMIATNEVELEEKVKNNIYPMAIKIDDENYKGITYDFLYDESLNSVKIERIDGYMEPALADGKSGLYDDFIGNIIVAEPGVKSKICLVEK